MGKCCQTKVYSALVFFTVVVFISHHKPDSETPWGNRFGFLHVPIPNLKDPKSPNPIEFVQAAQEVMKKKKSSFGVYLTGRLLEIVKKLRGPEVHT